MKSHLIFVVIFYLLPCHGEASLGHGDGSDRFDEELVMKSLSSGHVNTYFQFTIRYLLQHNKSRKNTIFSLHNRAFLVRIWSCRMAFGRVPRVFQRRTDVVNRFFDTEKFVFGSTEANSIRLRANAVFSPVDENAKCKPIEQVAVDAKIFQELDLSIDGNEPHSFILQLEP